MTPITRHCMPRRNSKSERLKRAARLVIGGLAFVMVCCAVLTVCAAVGIGAGR